MELQTVEVRAKLFAEPGSGGPAPQCVPTGVGGYAQEGEASSIQEILRIFGPGLSGLYEG